MDKASGFCVFNNVAVAVRHAQQVHGLERVVVLDWDVHHGNGTNDIFAEDESVLFFSLHRYEIWMEGERCLNKKRSEIRKLAGSWKYVEISSNLQSNREGL